MASFIIWSLAALTYFYQYFMRVAVGSLSGYLMSDFSLTIFQINDLAVLFFISYVTFLLIAGILIDRFGVKIMLFLASFVAGVACFIFAYSTNEIQLIIGRFAMGASASFSLTGAQTIIRMYFSDRLFPIFSGLTLTVGVIGAIVGGLPLIEASRYEGWRIIMQYAGCGSITLAFLLYLFLGKKKQLHNSEYDFKHLMKDFKQFLKTRRAWLPGIYGGLMLSPIIAFASFWAAPFLITHYNYSLEFAEFLASFVFIGYACGSPAHALLAEKVGLKKAMISAPTVATICMILLLSIKLPLPLMIICLFIQGTTVGAFVLTMVITKLSTPQDIAASSFGFNVLISQLVGASVLWIIGHYIYIWHHVAVGKTRLYPVVSLYHAMYLLIAASLLAIVIASLIKIPVKEVTKS